MWNELFHYLYAKGDMLLLHLTESAIALALLYIPYTLTLRREHFFRQNRLTLITILLLSLALPFCDFHALHPGNLMPQATPEIVPTVVEEPQPMRFPTAEPIAFGATDAPQQVAFTEQGNSPISFMEAIPYLCILYIIGVLVAIAIRLGQFIRMDRLIRRGSLWHDTVDGITIYCHASDIAPYSWMRRIVISQHDYDNHRHEILLHERGHVLCRHSWDILLLMLVQTVQWYNPFAYMLGASLRDVHEYEADDYVLRQGVSAGQYQTLLLKTAVGASAYSFANNFNHSKIKNRIVMMKSKRNSPWRRWKILYALPVIVIALCLFASPKDEKGISVTKSRLEVVGKRTPFSNRCVYIYNPKNNDSHIYLGYYYTAEQLDSIFGERTRTYIDDEGWADYIYNHEGVRILMSPYQEYEHKEYLIGDMIDGIPADLYGMHIFFLTGKKYKVQIDNVGIQVGDNINIVNWKLGHYKYREDVFVDDGSVRIIYIIDGYDWLWITHKNDTITEIRYDLDWT